MRALRKTTPGLRSISYALIIALLQPWFLIGSAFGAYNDQTDTRFPVDTDDSYDFAVADIDGVNGFDVLVANRGQSRLLVNDGSGNFVDETATRLPAMLHTTLAVAFADVDGVNGVDALLVGDGQNRILINNGSGFFTDQTAARLPVGNATSLDVALDDVDGDGDIDAVVANRASANQLLLNNGAGVFAGAPAGRLAADTDLSYGVALDDVNGDGSPDIFFANFSGQNRLHLNDNLGTFTDVTAAQLPVALDGSGDAVIFDADGDGDNDIAVAQGGAGVGLLINSDGAGTFVQAGAGQVPVVNGFAVKVVTGDIDFDGSLDLLVGALGQDHLLLNDGAGTFSDATATELPVDDRRSFGVAFVDADEDFDLDLLVATPQGQNRYYDNGIAAPRILIDITPDYIEVTDTVSILVSTFDEDGVASTSVQIVQPDTSTTAPTDLGGGQYSFVPSQIGVHSVSVTSTDNLANVSNRQAAFLAQANDVADPIVTVNVTPDTVTQGQSASFQVTATDDRGVVSRTLTVGGVNVPLTSAGTANYAPLAIGALTVLAEAADAAGNSGFQSTTITVLADVDDPVVTLSATPDPVDITNPIAINASATDNIAVASFGVTVTGPAGGPVDQPIALNAAGAGSYTPFIPGTYTFTATATDPAGNVATQVVAVVAAGIPDNEAPVVDLVAVPGATIPGGTVTLTVNATDNVFVLSRTLEVNGAPLVLDASHQAQFVPPTLGSYTAVATATDPTGNTGTDTVVFNAVDPSTDTAPPVVSITAPAEGSDITGVAEFTGTATDLTLVSYELAYRATGSGDPFTTFDTGTQAVESGVLGALDTSVLENGLYDIRLSAIDINGLSAQTIRVYTADGEFKPGVFTITYTDLKVPVAGIPITIKRTYDSRRRSAVEDFGNGWHLEVENEGTYTNNRELGAGWFITPGGGFFNPPCSIANEDLFHITEVRFSDTEFYKFAFQVEFFGFGSAISGGCTGGQVSFVQVGGVPGATLDIIGTNEVAWMNGSDSLTYDIFDSRFGLVYNPQDVRLTTLDGREYDLNLINGVERIGDANGNSLFISNSGVVHSSGKSVSFTRDGQGRITTIRDPVNNPITYSYDSNGDLSLVTDRAANATTFVYAPDHYLTQIIDPLGNTPLRNEYDAGGRLIAQIDGAGNRREYDHDVINGTETVTDGGGTIRVVQYDEDGNVVSGSVGAAASTFTYDSRGNKLTETNPNGFVRSFTYNANDQMTSETDPLGNLTSYAYDSAGRITQIAAAGGEELNFSFDTNGNVTAQRDANGDLVQGLTYNAQGNPTALTTAAGVTTLGYDASGNATTITSPNGLVRSFNYDTLGRRTSSAITRTVGGSPVVESTAYTYDGNGNVLTITDPLGGVTTYAYDGSNRRTSLTDSLGRVTSYQYDSRGNLSRISHPDGTSELFSYDLRSRKTAHTDTGGRTSFFEYDSGDRLTRVIYADGGTTVSTFNAGGNLLTQTDTLGNVTTYTYDGLNRVLTETDAAGGVTTYTYDFDQVSPATKTDPNGNVTTYVYDTTMLFSEYLTQTQLPDGATVGKTYGANGRVTSVTDPRGNVTSYTYDEAANLLTVTDALGGVTSYTYDEAGNRLTQTDALGRTTSFTYDALGRMLSKSLPGGQAESWTYDAMGNVLTHVDFSGATTTYTYDSRDRLVSRTFPDSSVESYTYTNGGMLATATSALGTWTFGYDVRDRLVSAASPDGVTLNYVYDTAGNRISITSPEGTILYAFDEVDRIISVTDPDAGVTGYEYDASGNVTGIDYPNGTSAVLTYDSRNRTARVTHLAPDGTTVLADYLYDVDAAGNRVQVIETAGRTLDYSYDVLNRLSSVTDGTSTSGYSYDAVGNIISIPLPGGGSETATYDVNDRILTVGARSFAYDPRGNLTTITDGVDVTTFTYDARNRLIQRVEPGGTVSQFTYDAAGNRVSRTVNGVTTGYVVDLTDPSGLAQTLLERDGAGTVQASYVYGHGLVSSDRSGIAAYFHPDALGSARLLTNASGAVTDSYDYDAYGTDAGSTVTTTNEFRFAGQRLDPDTGLYYMRERYYDPEVARFISRDPAQGDPFMPMTLHPYQYAFNNPVNAIDPTGRFGMISISISISISATLATLAYNTILKPAKEVYDEINEIAINIPNLRLNESSTREALGFNAASVEAALDAEDITQVVNLGGGAVEKAYGVVYKMSTTAGKVVSLIHANNSATWMKWLPEHDGKPAHYVNCGFNHFVKKEYALGLVTGLAAAKRFSLATNIIAIYLSYFTFLALVGNTVSDQHPAPQPADDPSLFGDEPACPGLFE
ncbi:MAG: FG-GAP-like repeat-containing protein [Pseudomonadales bacterium]